MGWPSSIDQTLFFHSRIPLMRVEGPLIVAQLLETTFLTLVNFARYNNVIAISYWLAGHARPTIISLYTVWSRQMQQDTALRPDHARFSFWSLVCAEPRGLTEAYQLPNTLMSVRIFLLSAIGIRPWPGRSGIERIFNFICSRKSSAKSYLMW